MEEVSLREKRMGGEKEEAYITLHCLLSTSCYYASRLPVVCLYGKGGQVEEKKTFIYVRRKEKESLLTGQSPYGSAGGMGLTNFEMYFYLVLP